MSKAITNFENFWRQMDISTRENYMHPADAPFMTPVDAAKAQLQLQVLPLPVNGNLRRAEVILVMLNSGYGDADAAWERFYPEEYAAMLDSKRANIHQRHSNEGAYPFYDLNPLFRNHPGAAYWKGDANLVVPQKTQKRKLAGIASELARGWQSSLSDVYQELSSRVAVVQLLAYASKDARRLGSLLERLPSCAEAVLLVKGLVAEGEKLVIIIRAAKAYGFTGPENNTDGLVVYKPVGEARGGHLTMASPGGPAIVKRLLAQPPSRN